MWDWFDEKIRASFQMSHSLRLALIMNIWTCKMHTLYAEKESKLLGNTFFNPMQG